MSATKNIIFLFGSGISEPAKLPLAGELTEIILSGEGIIRATDGTYYLSDDKSGYFLTHEYIPRVKSFIERIKVEIDSYYSDDSHKTNYEDLYYVISQIRDSELLEYDNPAIKPLIDKILSDIKPLFNKRENDTYDDWTLLDLANEAANYIRDVVWRSLLKIPKRLDHLRIISDAYLDKNLTSIDICTLNHDTLLEQYLFNHGIRINDGFGVPINDLRYWNPDLLESKDLKVRLLKLHGSINWFGFIPNNNMGLEKIAIPLDWDIWHTKDSSGHRQWPAGGRPMFLAGTFNKMLDYNFDIYADQHYHFHKSLRETSLLIVCGYGFRDKGVNRKIVDWIYSGDQHKLLIIHPEPDKLVLYARGAIHNNWDDWLSKNKLDIIQKRIEDVEWSNVSDCL